MRKAAPTVNSLSASAHLLPRLAKQDQGVRHRKQQPAGGQRCERFGGGGHRWVKGHLAFGAAAAGDMQHDKRSSA